MASIVHRPKRDRFSLDKSGVETPSGPASVEPISGEELAQRVNREREFTTLTPHQNWM